MKSNSFYFCYFPGLGGVAGAGTTIDTRQEPPAMPRPAGTQRGQHIRQNRPRYPYARKNSEFASDIDNATLQRRTACLKITTTTPRMMTLYPKRLEIVATQGDLTVSRKDSAFASGNHDATLQRRTACLKMGRTTTRIKILYSMRAPSGAILANTRIRRKSYSQHQLRSKLEVRERNVKQVLHERGR